jgi:hypothetical protein
MIKTHVLQMGGGAQTAGLVVQPLGAAKQSLANFCNRCNADPNLRLDSVCVVRSHRGMMGKWNDQWHVAACQNLISTA